MVDLTGIPELHDQANASWHEIDASALEPSTFFLRIVLRQHRANFDLWHQEDRARDPHATDAEIAEVKRAIDRLNQQRNDLAEDLDVQLLHALDKQDPQAPLHSESPGLIIDRLSILSLKLFHTIEQTQRTDVDQAHIARNKDRLRLLHAQRRDLALCLNELWLDLLAGRRQFKLYKQLKMYNDPTLNPVLYRVR